MFKKINSILRGDLLVAGGGVAGVCCALQSAREGCRVILCQNRPVLGGNASSEIRMHMVGADAHGSRGLEMATEAREGGLVEEIRLRNCIANPQRSNSMFDLTLYDMCRSEPNIILLLNTEVVGVKLSFGKIESVFAERASTEDSFEIFASVFVDATGDGRLGFEAGADFRVGREGRNEYAESLAQTDADSFKLGSSLLYQAKLYKKPMPFQAPAWSRKIEPADLQLRMNLDDPHCRLGLEYGFWWLEWGGHLDTIKDNEKIRDELMAILMGVWDYIKNSGKYPESTNWAMEWCGFVPGKRESRRFLGPWVLSQNDVLEAREFDDAIAYGGWWIDTHPPMGVDSPDEPPCNQHIVPWLYSIPLRACLSRNISNLMFAGRNISATHLAFASTRVMATCGAIGQGVGAAAAEAIRRHILPVILPANKSAIKSIQQNLLRDDAYLLGVWHDDIRDHVTRANISCDNGDASPILSGQTRSTHGQLGARNGQTKPGVHRWISKSLPAALIIKWDMQIVISEIRLIFDTGLHRELTLSLCDHVAARQHWGRAQPETVCDYQLHALMGDQWLEIVNEENNFLRLRTYRFDSSILTSSLKLTVTKTNGIPQARVCEIRVY